MILVGKRKSRDGEGWEGKGKIERKGEGCDCDGKRKVVRKRGIKGTTKGTGKGKGN